MLADPALSEVTQKKRCLATSSVNTDLLQNCLIKQEKSLDYQEPSCPTEELEITNKTKLLKQLRYFGF